MAGGIEVIEIAALVATLLASLVMSGVALYKAWRVSPEEKANAMQSYQEMLDKTAGDLKMVRADVVLLQVENRTLRVRINELEADVISYRKGINRLIKQLESHDISPSWRPEI
jgi:predicted RNase H-like nuclease (RuvC/YqgF family)